MIGMLVKNGTDVVDKQVFSGDDAKSLELIDIYKAKNPDLTIEIYQEENKDFKSSFEDVVLVSPKSSEQISWEAAKGKGTDAAIAFIAKKLGLE